jgi:uncharacterized protein YaiI (UPF0178 family)
VLNPRGELYTKDNIRERPSRCGNFIDELRKAAGRGTRRAARLCRISGDRQAFANALDSISRRMALSSERDRAERSNGHQIRRRMCMKRAD